MHPFDLKTALLARHAQHVVLIHFPIALFIIGVAFDYAGQFSRRAALTSAAYYNLLIAAVTAVPAVVTGIMAWQWQLDGRRLHGLLLLHLLLGTMSAVLIWLVWWLHFRTTRAGRPLPGYRLPLEALAVFIVALTGHLGGFLSGVNAPG